MLFLVFLVSVREKLTILLFFCDLQLLASVSKTPIFFSKKSQKTMKVMTQKRTAWAPKVQVCSNISATYHKYFCLAFISYFED